MTDGPYAETKEQMGGFWVIEAADLDAALDLGRQGRRGLRGPGRGPTDPGRMTTGRERGGQERGDVDELAGIFRREAGRCTATLDPHPRRHRPRRGCGRGGVRHRRASGGRSPACRRTPAAGSRPPPATGPSTGCAGSRPAPTATSPPTDCTPTTTIATTPWTTDEPGARRPRRVRRRRRRRPAPPDVPVLPPRARRRRPGGAHAAAARRPRDARDRPRLPRARGDDRPADRAGQAQAARQPRPLPRPAAPPSCPTGCTRCSPRSTSIFTEGHTATSGDDARARRPLAARRSGSAACSSS